MHAHIHMFYTHTYLDSYSKWIDGEVDIQQELKTWCHYVIVSKVLRQVRHPQFKKFWATSILKMLHHLLLPKNSYLQKLSISLSIVL